MEKTLLNGGILKAASSVVSVRGSSAEELYWRWNISPNDKLLGKYTRHATSGSCPYPKCSVVDLRLSMQMMPSSTKYVLTLRVSSSPLFLPKTNTVSSNVIIEVPSNVSVGEVQVYPSRGTSCSTTFHLYASFWDSEVGMYCHVLRFLMASHSTCLCNTVGRWCSSMRLLFRLHRHLMHLRKYEFVSMRGG